MWGALANAFGVGEAPSQPQALTMQMLASDNLSVRVRPQREADYYTCFTSLNGLDFDSAGVSLTGAFLLEGLSPGDLIYCQVRATNQIGHSPLSATGVAAVSSGINEVLLVGADETAHDTAVQCHAKAFVAIGRGVDYACREAVRTAAIPLNAYSMVDWPAGQPVARKSLEYDEQLLLISFLENGGRLLISGADIASQLGTSFDAFDGYFLKRFLKATYQGAGPATGMLSPEPNSFLADMTPFEYGDSGAVSYEFSPDILNPYQNSRLLLNYASSVPTRSEGAAVGFLGAFNQSPVVGAVVFLGFPLEAVADSLVRIDLLRRLVEFLESTLDVSSEMAIPDNSLMIGSNYPNPANPATHFPLILPDDKRSSVQLRIYDLQGCLVDEFFPVIDGRYGVAHWNGLNRQGQEAASGVYFVEALYSNQRAYRKFMLLR